MPYQRVTCKSGHSFNAYVYGKNSQIVCPECKRKHEAARDEQARSNLTFMQSSESSPEPFALPAYSFYASETSSDSSGFSSGGGGDFGGGGASSSWSNSSSSDSGSSSSSSD